MARPNQNISVVDLFCGAGGLSHGFLLEGMPIACGLDIDEDCRYAFEKNNKAPYLKKDITKVTGDEILEAFGDAKWKILVGCAPCQPFSTYSQARIDPKWVLLSQFSRLIDEAKPDIVSMENVPRLMEFHEGKVFQQFVDRLEESGYTCSYKIVFCPDYGIPQKRSRLVLMASKWGKIDFEEPSHKSSEYRTVSDTIGHLPKIKAGQQNIEDPMHFASELSPLNMKRMKVAKPGGTWRDWPKDLVAACHNKKSGKTYPGVYGRMKAEEPSPTMTTQFYGFGNGRFGHPSQHRAISLREGALLQTFPEEYEFVAPSSPIQFKKLGRMIGNAVPVDLGRMIARSIKIHLSQVEQASIKTNKPRQTRYAKK